jgi:hypothetical protein
MKSRRRQPHVFHAGRNRTGMDLWSMGKRGNTHVLIARIDWAITHTKRAIMVNVTTVHDKSEWHAASALRQQTLVEKLQRAELGQQRNTSDRTKPKGIRRNGRPNEIMGGDDDRSSWPALTSDRRIIGAAPCFRRRPRICGKRSLGQSSLSPSAPHGTGWHQNGPCCSERHMAAANTTCT